LCAENRRRELEDVLIERGVVGEELEKGKLTTRKTLIKSRILTLFRE
jgi:hypothetical protein